MSTDYLLLEEIEEWREKPSTANYPFEPQPVQKSFEWNKRICSLVLLSAGILYTLITIICAGLYSEEMTAWYTHFGPFGTALLFTWRAIFLYLGLGLILVALFLLLDLGTRIRQMNLINRSKPFVIPAVIVFLYILARIGFYTKKITVYVTPVAPLLLIMIYFLVFAIVKIIRKKKRITSYKKIRAAENKSPAALFL